MKDRQNKNNPPPDLGGIKWLIKKESIFSDLELKTDQSARLT